MDVSVIICSYNREDSLRKTLTTLCDLEIPPHLNWELLLVDNNSTDGTRQVCESFIPKLPVRYLFEPLQGVNRARNRAVAEAAGQLLLFTDDDVNVDKNWLAAFWRAAQQYPEISFFGGRIHPTWEIPPPKWLGENSKSLLKPVAVYLDFGEEDKLLTEPGPILWSGNIAFRRLVFTESCKFREDVGRNTRDQVRGGETEFTQRLLDQGHQRFYVAGAIVHHRTPANRGTDRYVFAHYKGSGMTQVRINGPPTSNRMVLGVPRLYWWKLVRHGVKYAVTRWTRPSKIWLPALIETGRSWGLITESRRVRAG